MDCPYTELVLQESLGKDWSIKTHTDHIFYHLDDIFDPILSLFCNVKLCQRDKYGLQYPEMYKPHLFHFLDDYLDDKLRFVKIYEIRIFNFIDIFKSHETQDKTRHRQDFTFLNLRTNQLKRAFKFSTIQYWNSLPLEI